MGSPTGAHPLPHCDAPTAIVPEGAHQVGRLAPLAAAPPWRATPWGAVADVPLACLAGPRSGPTTQQHSHRGSLRGARRAWPYPALSAPDEARRPGSPEAIAQRREAPL